MSEPPSSPRAGLWQNLPNTILIRSQHPRGSRFMPAAPIAREGGIVAFPPEVEKDWEEYLQTDAKNRSMLSDEQYALYRHYLQHPDTAAEATESMTRKVAASLKHRVKKNYLLDGNEVYRQKSAKHMRIRYAARSSNAFRIIANIHSQLSHQGINRTHDKILENYHGITEHNVKWVLSECGVCILNAPQAVKVPPIPIVSARCMDRVQIDLVDQRSKIDGEFCWLLQIKDCFSHYVWLHALKDKTAAGVAERVSEWIGYVGAPRLMQCDNGTEFKGALLELCARHKIEVRNSSPFHPQTNGAIEVANKIFKNRLRALQTEFGTGVSDWVQFLPELSLTLNTTRPKRFPKGMTPYSVFFGRGPHWLSSSGDGDDTAAMDIIAVTEAQRPVDAPRWTPSIFRPSVERSPSLPPSPCSVTPPVEASLHVNDADSSAINATAPTAGLVSSFPERAITSSPSPRTVVASVEDDSDGFVDIEELVAPERETEEKEAELELNGDERILAARKKIDQDKMRAAVAAAAKNFETGQIVTVKIPKQVLLPGEPGRLVVRVCGYNQGGYQVATQHGIITKRFGGGTLNSVRRSQEVAYQKHIPIVPMKDGKILRIKLTKAVQAHYQRSSVQAAQKKGRKAAKTALPAPPTALSPPRRSNQDSPIMLSDGEISSANASTSPSPSPTAPTATASTTSPITTRASPRRHQTTEPEQSAQHDAVKPAVGSRKGKKRTLWEYKLVESSDSDFERPPTDLPRFRSRQRARTEPV